ncbi:MAG: flagellar protein FlaG [Lachnospiraceae bacterium]|nr:flagellar protein FlaG [Lachnospiraceae bacterium]
MKIESAAVVNKPVYTDAAASRPRPEVQAAQTVQTTQAQPVEVQAEAQVQQAGQEQTGNPENDSRRIKSAVDHANQTMRQSKTKCEFSYHEETKRVSIKVIDAETEEVIREIPPEETLEMISKMWELAGLMVDEKR